MAKSPSRRTDTAPRTTTRCAIYTRKSTEDGLEQEFNSLDAQREACAAYILSQRHEGWTLVPDYYDDGGFSGGSMDRPGLKQLLGEVEAGNVDVIVVYKVDRLTRSLADFAKIVEVLDNANASFVSVTQSFNTTTSMGRLTLNVLLSFAQFEREVTGERIRDKIAASKAKGMWMGGPVPLGYDVKDRKLLINDTEAATVRHVFQRYLQLGSVYTLVDSLADDGTTTKARTMVSGRIVGGTPFGRGGLVHLLRNHIYVGEVSHRGTIFPGEHDGIIGRDLWDAVQKQLNANILGRRHRGNAQHSSLLVGLVFDGHGRRMTPSHANKGTRRFRYYITHRDALIRNGEPQWRLPAPDLEHIVVGTIADWLRSADRELASASLEPSAAEMTAVRDRAACLAATLGSSIQAEQRDVLAQLVERVDVRENEVAITVRQKPLLGSDADSSLPVVTLIAPATRVRRGDDVRLVIGEQDSSANRDGRLVALMAEARAARDHLLASPEGTLDTIAAQYGQSRKHFSRLVRLAYLAPDIVAAIVDGRQPVQLTRTMMLVTNDIPQRWDDQRAVFGFAPAA